MSNPINQHWDATEPEKASGKSSFELSQLPDVSSVSDELKRVYESLMNDRPVSIEHITKAGNLLRGHNVGVHGLQIPINQLSSRITKDDVEVWNEIIKLGAPNVDPMSFARMTFIPPGIMSRVIRGSTLPSFKAIRDLPIESARILSTWKPALFDDTMLKLDGLTELDEEKAGALAHWKGAALSFAGLQSLSPESAKALAQWEGVQLSLNGLQNLFPEVADALSRWEGASSQNDKVSLSLDGLQHLPPDVAEALSPWKGNNLVLNGLTFISPESAEFLAQWSGKNFYLNGVRGLSPATAAELAKWKGEMFAFGGIQTLLDQSAKNIARWKGKEINLLYLANLTPAGAKALVTFSGEIYTDNRHITDLIKMYKRK